MGHCIYIVFVYYVMFNQFVQQCMIIRIVLLWFIINRFITCPPRETEIVKAALMIRNICRKKMILMYWLIKFCLFLYILSYCYLHLNEQIRSTFVLLCISGCPLVSKKYCKGAAVFLCSTYSDCILCIFFQRLTRSMLVTFCYFYED